MKYKLSELCKREYPDATTPFLRCQIGRIEHVKISIGKKKTRQEPVFHLVGYGPTWKDAHSML